MSIIFTQYKLPDGAKSQVEINMAPNVEEVARALIERGCFFEIEILRTGEISMTCEKGDELISMELCQNNVEVIKAVEGLVKDAAEREGIKWIEIRFV